MTLRYSHLVPEHKAQAVSRLGERFKSDESKSQNEVVMPELKATALLTPSPAARQSFCNAVLLLFFRSRDSVVDSCVLHEV